MLGIPSDVAITQRYLCAELTSEIQKQRRKKNIQEMGSKRKLNNRNAQSELNIHMEICKEFFYCRNECLKSIKPK